MDIMMFIKGLCAAAMMFVCRIPFCLSFELNLGLVLNIGAGTTAVPDVCRDHRQTQSCSDAVFRQTCPHWCDVKCPGYNFTYIEARHLCYAMTKHETAAWSHAQEHCRAYGARLARIETLEDSRVVKMLQNTTAASDQTRFSVGAANFGMVDEWAWLDGSQLDSTEGFWAAGYPLILPNKPSCGYIFTEDINRKENNICNQHFGFICEQSPKVRDIYDRHGDPMTTSEGNTAIIISSNNPEDFI